MSNSQLSEKEFLEKLGNEKFGVSELAREMGMSRSSIHRKKKEHLKISVVPPTVYL